MFNSCQRKLWVDSIYWLFPKTCLNAWGRINDMQIVLLTFYFLFLSSDRELWLPGLFVHKTNSTNINFCRTLNLCLCGNQLVWFMWVFINPLGVKQVSCCINCLFFNLLIQNCRTGFKRSGRESRKLAGCQAVLLLSYESFFMWPAYYFVHTSMYACS